MKGNGKDGGDLNPKKEDPVGSLLFYLFSVPFFSVCSLVPTSLPCLALIPLVSWSL
ncbi:hypothetical protein B0O80DRAFT_439639 [Mortierella sp. GBAus27b]|nr:hypothetical protein B0O80DRAFT_439639 [Mortierella sp. GBAus27b]